MEPNRLSAGLAFFLLLAAFGCAEEEKPKVESPEPVILSFTNSAAEIGAGESSTLLWQTRDAISLELVDGVGNRIDLGNRRPVAGSVMVAPSETTTYRLTAIGQDGKTAQAEQTIAVRPAPDKPIIEEFTASEDTVPVNDTITLSWSVDNARTIEIFDARGALVPISNEEAEAGEAEVQVRESTSFTLVAEGRGGRAEATIDVRVEGSPLVSFAGPANPILPGSEARLTWTVERATQVRVTDGAGSEILYEGPLLRGDVRVKPSTESDYLLVATGEGGDTLARATVRIQPLIDEFSVVDEVAVRVGDEVEVSWKTRGASQLEIHRVGAAPIEIEEDQILAGTMRLPMPTGGAFTLVARSGATEVSATAHGLLELAPRLLDVSFHPRTATASPDTPAQVQIHWSADGARDVTVEQVGVGVLPTMGKSAREDFVTATVHGPSSFRVTVANEDGEDTIVRDLTVFPAPRIVDLSPLPHRAELGEEITVFWETMDAARVVLERDGADVGIPTTQFDGSVKLTMGAASTEFVLRTYNDDNFEVVSDPVRIELGAPEIESFLVDRPVVHAGVPLEFSWRNVGGQSARIELAGGEICSTTDLREVAEGGCSTNAPLTAGSHVYELLVESGLGTVVRQPLTVVVTDGPVIESFELDQPLVTVGMAVTFTWTVSDDAAGTTPTLTLVDDLGNSYDVSPAGVASGTYVIAPMDAGIRTYTLEADSPGTSPHARTLDVDVRGIPEIDFGAVERILDTEGQPTAAAQLVWDVQHGESLSLHTVNFEGNVDIPALFETDDAATVASGSHVVDVPPGIHYFRLVVDNGAMTQLTADVEIRVDTVEVEFSADKNQIYNGEPVTFTWSVKRADEWSFTKPIPLIIEGEDPIIDVPNSPTRELLLVEGSVTSGVVDVTFPPGFTFPWNGEDYTQARMSVNGWIGLGAPTETGSVTNAVLPASSYPYKSLFAFWDALDLYGNGNIHGRLMFDSGFDDKGRYIVFHWHDVTSTSASATNPQSFNFQTILWEDGTFAYRYGEMRGASTSSATTGQSRADAESATIGYQFNGGLGYMWTHNQVVFGRGLSHTSLTFDPRPPANSGSRTVRVWTGSSTVVSSTIFGLSGSNAINTEGGSVTLESDGPANIEWFRSDADEETPGSSFTIYYDPSSTVSKVELFHPDGSLLKSSTSNSSSSLSRSESAPGLYEYRLRVVGKRSWDVQEKILPVWIYNPMSIDTFTASSTDILPGATVDLSWTATGAATARLLTEDGEEIDISSQPVNGGTVAVSPARTTTYRLIVEDDTNSGRIKEETLTVIVRRATLDSLTATPSVLPSGGGDVTLSWTTTDARGVSIAGYQPVVVGTKPFIDIENAADATELELLAAGTTSGKSQFIEFPFGFRFPWYGRLAREAWIAGPGFIGLGVETISTANDDLPDTAHDDTHIAPFWDSLYAASSTARWGSVWYAMRTVDGEDALVVQWSHLRTSSSTTSTDDLNFQAILFASGKLEYRYGTMFTSTAARAEGSSATIAYQNWEGTSGFTFSHNSSVSGGLENKSITFELAQPANGSVELTVTGTSDLMVCANDDGYQDCDTVTVTVGN